MSDFIISVEHLFKSVTDSTGTLDILRDVDFAVSERETVSIVGASGSGKSTLLSIMAGLDTPSRGTVRLAGCDLFAISEDERAETRSQKIGFVFQTFNLQPGYTALENVMLPLVFAKVPLKQRKAKAAACLQAVGLKDRMTHRPNQLSGGERQRVSIARALVNDPEIIIADEPTGNLDSKTSDEVMALFRELNSSGQTVVMVTHNPENGRYADRTIRLKDGIVVAG